MPKPKIQPETRHGCLDRYKKKNTAKGSIKVVSYNIKFAKKMSRAIKLMQTNDNLKDADIVCLQEMNEQAARKFAEELNYNYIYYSAAYHKGAKKYLGNAICSKFTIKDDIKIILPRINTNISRRNAVAATVEVNGKNIRVFSMHKEVLIKKGLRARQIKAIFETLDPQFRQCIIAGDFNTYTNASLRTVTKTLEDEGFLSATANVGWTFRHWYLLNKKSVLDHIFIRGLEVIQSGKVNDRSASDHLPIWAELSIE